CRERQPCTWIRRASRLRHVSHCGGGSVRSTSAPDPRSRVPMSNDLSGRVALVTGAGSGIGRAVALALASAGARVAAHYNTSAAAARQPPDPIERPGSAGVLVQADLSDEAAATAAVDRAAAHFGGLDVLVNNAGDPLSRSPLADCPTALWRRAFAVNVD